MVFYKRDEFYDNIVELNNKLYPFICELNTHVLGRNLDNITILYNNKVSEIANYFNRHGEEFFGVNRLAIIIMNVLTITHNEGIKILEKIKKTKHIDMNEIDVYRHLCDFLEHFDLDKQLAFVLNLYYDKYINDVIFCSEFIEFYDKVREELTTTIDNLELTDGAVLCNVILIITLKKAISLEKENNIKYTIK